MSINIQCPGCGKNYQLGNDLAGKRVKCKCGQSMVVPPPAAAETPDDSDYGLAPLSGADSPDSLWDEVLPAAAAAPDAGLAGSPAAVSGQETGLTPAADSQAKKPIRRAKKRSQGGLMSGLMVAGGLVGLLLLGTGFFLLVRSTTRSGYGSPEQALAAYQEALKKKNWRAQFRTLDPQSQVTTLGIMARYVVPMAESSAGIREVLAKHGGEELTKTEAATNAEPLVAAVKDKLAFYVELVAAMKAQEEEDMPRNPVLKVLAKKPSGEARRALADAALTDLQTEGDVAKGTLSFMMGGEEVEVSIAFKNVNGRWFVHVLEADSFAYSPVGESFGASGAIYY